MAGFGVLDVVVDGRVVFSRKAEGRIPAAAEIIDRVRTDR